MQSLVNFQVRIESECEAGLEKLVLEIIDLASGNWEPVELIHLNESGGVNTYTFAGKAKIPQKNVLEEIKKKISVEHLPDAEILDVQILVDNTPTALVRERSSFEIAVRVQFNKPIDAADVGIKITRTDGVYVFWQSSGIDGGNLFRPSGIKIFRFHFNNCSLGAGEYSLNVHVSNGWNYPQNYPYSHVLERSVGVLSFRIFPEMEGLDFGVINMRVPVSIE